jgi:ketopantoate reductase
MKHIVIIGAGSLGTAFAAALSHTGRGDTDRGGSGRTYESASAR